MRTHTLFDLKRQGILDSFEELTTDEDATNKRTIKRWRLKRAGISIDSLVADANAKGADVVVVDAESCRLPVRDLKTDGNLSI